MMLTPQIRIIFVGVLALFFVGVFLSCRVEGKTEKDSAIETLGWGVGFAAYFVADYLMLAASLN